MRAFLSLLVVTLAGVHFSGCDSRSETRETLFIGARSHPEFSAVLPGRSIDLGSGASLAVFGRGKLGRDTWGQLEIQYSDGHVRRYQTGGIVSVPPIDVTHDKISGEAEVPLFAFLLDTTVDRASNPERGYVRRKWLIEPGSFDIKLHEH